jgi:hypothetical protein
VSSHCRNNQVQEKPTHFFAKELAGEQPPTFETMQLLCGLASDLLERRPWDLLDESELVLVRGPVSGEICHCSVMGALGEVYALHAYLGPESYRFFRKLESGATITVGEFFASQYSVSVEFVRSAELEVADRSLLSALGRRQKKGALAPMFRTIRPGYHPWHVTEAEAKILAECLWAVITMCELLGTNDDLDYWDREDVYPLVSRGNGDEPEQKYEIKLTEVVNPPALMLEPATWDKTQVRCIREGKYPSRGAIELDHFYGAAMIGNRNERKACCRMALAIDSKTGFVYPPKLLLPSASTGDALVGAILQTIDAAGAVPREIRVKESTFKTLLEPLAENLGFQVRVVKSLPALDRAKESLLQMMGEPGPYTTFP